MRIQNQVLANLNRLNSVPEAMQAQARNEAMQQMVPFLKTAGLHFDVLSQEKVEVSVENRPAVQNHIGGVHACVMVTLAETATGFVVALNTPDDKLMLMRNMRCDFMKVSRGNMRAVATLSDEEAARIANEERGNMVIPCTVYDESGESPVVVEMIWAWLPKPAAA